ncbi:GNAT family N-acetyltransferase [Radiobacillus kanasensis]|uniref:GNAT family N-acetyltransferase n=1 Tax=Radiobacillus kanasensis TaxID=2844358 RepID=UPI001E4DD839|nr:GNAT family N-acetyltransferase [Radiobacillus kanasensis]UFT99995.1 GNAT family N-acetyltransferase [Radiobacillus kanasensis]
MGRVVTTSERLQLRKMVQDDVDYLQEIFADPIAMHYYPATKNIEETKRWIDWTKENYSKYNIGLWMVEDKETSSFLGQCGLVPQKVDGEVRIEVGYLFKRSVWGNGFATEAAQACLNYGKSHLDISEFISLIDVENTPSIKVAERIGMTYEKKIEKWDKDIAVYSIRL